MTANLGDLRNTERAKYRRIYERETYGVGNHGSQAIPIIHQEIKPRNVLDVGCGSNAFCKLLRPLGIEAVGVDFASPLADVPAPAHDLPFLGGAFDLLTAFDVLEHLLPEEVPEVMDEFARVARRAWLFSICCRDSTRRSPDGSTLHPTVRPKRWWVDCLSRYGQVEMRGKYFLVTLTRGRA